MATRELGFHCGRYSDGTWWVSYVEVVYVRGKRAKRKLVARRVVDVDQVLDHARLAVKDMIKAEIERQGDGRVETGKRE